jgi:hypothetical protein
VERGRDRTHGYTAAEAEDFRGAVLAMVDQASLAVGTGASGSVVSKTVDDVSLSWSGAVAAAPIDKAALDAYRLLAFGCALGLLGSSWVCERYTPAANVGPHGATQLVITQR